MRKSTPFREKTFRVLGFSMPTLTGEYLESLYATHHRLEKLYPDPLVFARDRSALDGEAAGLVAASLAYGRVEQIVAALTKIFAVLGPSPRQTLLNTRPENFTEPLRGFVYRFHKGPDMAIFFTLLGRALSRHGSLKDLYIKGMEEDPGKSLANFCNAILAEDPRPHYPASALPPGHPVRFLLASPSGGGAAKRMCLYLRWMIRKDALDPGYWEGVMPRNRLLVPLDTHVAKVGRHYGLTRRAGSGWKTALDITQSLRRFDDFDPLRFDFTLFRFGMSGDYTLDTPD